MDRRTVIKMLSAAAIAGCGATDKEGKPLRVVVAGAGIVGASIAYHLAKAGAQVTVLDKSGPASHASGGTFAWINATWAKQPREYHALNQDSVSNWHVIQETLGIPIRWGGSLEWFANDDRQIILGEQIAEQAAWGERARMVEAQELAELEPGVNFGNASVAAFSENDGAVNPVLATQVMLDAAAELGADIRHPEELLKTRSKNGRLQSVVTSSGSIDADRLVLATGADETTCEKFAEINIPQRSRPGFIVTTVPTERLVNRVVAAPGAHFHQRDDGRIVIGEQDGAPDNAAHAARLAGRPNQFPIDSIAAEHAARIMSVANTFVPGIDKVEVEKVRIGWRPLPLDGHPVLGRSPNQPDVYITIMHSGVSLAPIVGHLTAQELTSDTENERLAMFRPDRNFEFIKRY